ncbi:MAG: AbrB/MazE/SpoVT family DNA-binding domain-containing protein [Myxococcota bacterium]
MDYYATVTSKGQITIPKAIRDELGLEPGDRLVFRRGRDGKVTVEPEDGDVARLRGMLKPRRRGVSLADMDAAVRRRAGRRS